MENNGFYFIKDEFFEKVNDPYLKGNKKSSRPHYYCLEDKKHQCYWMIPLSSKVEKFKEIESKIIAKRGKCDTIHIVDVTGRGESVFLIQDIFPITEKYIQNKYIINGHHFILNRLDISQDIKKKAKEVIMLRLRGVKLFPTQPDINKILNMIKDGTL